MTARYLDLAVRVPASPPDATYTWPNEVRLPKPKKLPAAFYQTSAGNEPVRDWFLDLEEGSRRIVGRDVATVEYGWLLGMPLCRKLGGGLLELRSRVAERRIARVIFVVYADHMVLLHGFVKKTRRVLKPDPGGRRTQRKGEHIMTNRKGRIGSSFEDYLAAQGTLGETNAMAVKRVLAWELEQAMQRRRMSKSAMADRMRTSRRQLDRILDPDSDHIRLETVAAAAREVGLNLKIELVR